MNFNNTIYLKETIDSPNPYLYNPKVLHPNQNFIISETPNNQPPFYFGGSQVIIPETNNISGTGIYKKTNLLKTDKRYRSIFPISIPSIKKS